MLLPMTNMISGGLHAGGNLDFQDFLILPVGMPLYSVGLEWIVRVHRRLGESLSAAGCEGRLVADEGGFGPRLASNRQALEYIMRAIEAAGLQPGRDVALALDVASTHFFDGSHYRLAATGDERLSNGRIRSSRWPNSSTRFRWSAWKMCWPRRIGPAGSNSRPGWAGACNSSATICSRPIPQRLRRGIELHAANSVLVKVNQIGTLSETFETIRVARSAGFSLVVSARSGETEDSTMADLAVAVAADQIKIGSITRSERLAKYNRLLAIEERLGGPAQRLKRNRLPARRPARHTRTNRPALIRRLRPRPDPL